MDDCEKWHVEQLAKHCRVCGQRLHKGKKRSSVYSCEEKKEDLEFTFGIRPADSGTFYPTHFCGSCYLKIKRAKESTKKGTPYNPYLSLFHWTPHLSTTTCTVRDNTTKPKF